MKKIKDILFDVLFYAGAIVFLLFMVWAYNWSFNNTPMWYSRLTGYLTDPISFIFPLSFIFVALLIYLLVSLVAGVVKKIKKGPGD